jgi:hypothetical protein
MVVLRLESRLANISRSQASESGYSIDIRGTDRTQQGKNNLTELQHQSSFKQANGHRRRSISNLDSGVPS